MWVHFFSLLLSLWNIAENLSHIPLIKHSHHFCFIYMFCVHITVDNELLSVRFQWKKPSPTHAHTHIVTILLMSNNDAGSVYSILFDTCSGLFSTHNTDDVFFFHRFIIINWTESWTEWSFAYIPLSAGAILLCTHLNCCGRVGWIVFFYSWTTKKNPYKNAASNVCAVCSSVLYRTIIVW